LSEDDKETILSAVKETTEWLDENPNAEAEDYEDKLSELQATVAVGPKHFSFAKQADI
jgi:heat shock protein 5